MGKQVTLQRINIADTAAFRVWGQMIATGLVAAGLVKTADTGQIDWLTANKPGSINTYAGYEIYRSNDGDGETIHNFYIKVEYGVGSNVLYGSIRMTVGWATDGAGTVTGNTSSTFAAVNTASNANEVYTYIAGDAGWLTILIDPNNQHHGFAAIERTRNFEGAYEGDRVAVYFSSGGNTGSPASAVIPKEGLIPPSNAFGSNSSVMLPNGNNRWKGELGYGLLFPQAGVMLSPTSLIIGGNPDSHNPINSYSYVNMFGEDMRYVYTGAFPKLGTGAANVGYGLVRIE